MPAISRFAAIAACVLLFTLTVFSQTANTGAIRGTVQDVSGAVVSGATVSIINLATGTVERSIATDAQGIYAATLLGPGKYRVEVTATGFRKYHSTVSVVLNETTRENISLQIGTAEEVIEVTSTTTLINTENATTGQAVDARTLQALPLPVPNYMMLLALSPGTAGEPVDVRAANRGIVDINVNGQRTTNNSVSIDGINVNDFNLAHFDTVPLPNPNTIAEFRVATSLYDASMGNKGGGALNAVLRTGTKDLHWNAYWNHRNDYLNANEWFFKNAHRPRGRLLQNVLGFSGSGPAWGLGGFWFANVNGVRGRNGVDPNGASISPVIPRLQNLNSDGTVSAAGLSTQFGVPVANIDPVALNILNFQSDYYGGQFFVPREGQSGCVVASATTLRCSFSKVAPIKDTQYTITYDRFVRGDKDKLGVRWFWDNGSTEKPFGTAGAPQALNHASGSVQNNRLATISYTTQITNRQLNEFRFGFNRFISAFLPSSLMNLDDVGATRPNQAELPDIYSVTIDTLFQFGTGVNDDRGTVQNSFTWGDNWSMIRGHHTFRAGGEVNRFQLNRYNRFATRGSLTFGSAGGNSSFQNFLRGQATSLQSAAGDPQRYFRDTDFAFYFADDWKIHPHLTLNLGLRWEGLGFASELHNRLSNYDPERARNNGNPFVFAEDTNLGGFTGTADTDKIGNCLISDCRDTNNWAPRFGLAWDLFGSGKTVIRGGYGIYYQRISNQTTLQTNLGPPFNVQTVQNFVPVSAPLILANPFPGGASSSLINAAVIPSASIFAGLGRVAPTVVAGVVTACPAVSGPLNVNDPCNFALFTNSAGQFCSGFAPTGTPGSALALNCSINLASFTAPPLNFHAPYTQQWNFQIQQDFGKNWGLEVAYVGSHYVGGFGIVNPFLRLASPTNPLTVTDSSGNSYTITTNTALNEPLREQILGFSRAAGARFSANVGFAHYHGMQTTLSHRFSKGLFVQAAHTWSKTIDNVSGSQGTDEFNVTRNGQGGANMFNLGNINPALNRSLGDFDRRHRFVVSYSYDLQLPKTGILGTQAFQGWGVSGIVYAQQGLPFSVTTTAGGAAYGRGGLSTPNFTCANLDDVYRFGDTGTNVGGYLNLDCFANPGLVPFGATGATDYGNARRNAFRGPFQQSVDFSVMKKFTIVERHVLSFRTDFFNLFNHPVFQNPSSVAFTPRSATNPNPTFTPITNTAVPARIIQMGLRYEF
jgi:Carboxypeptidase regulatory-like domain